MNEGTLDFDPHDVDLVKVASLASPSDKRPQVPGYELERRMGEGSFGEVWSAHQVSTGQKVAVKILHRTDLGALVYLEREVARLANVSEHPNLLTLIDANLHHVPAFLVTPLLSGSLEQYAGRAIALAQLVDWMQQCAQALTFIHSRGILHCDLKPSNLLLDQEGRLRLVDFGQAHLLDQSGGSLGTLWYMPAEQVPVGGLQVHPEVGWDIYALGASFYWLLTGHPPRQSDQNNRSIAASGDTRAQLDEYRRLIRVSPLTPVRHYNRAVDQDLAAIVERCLHINPEQRYRSATELLADLDCRQRGYPVQARPRTALYVAGRYLARNLGLAFMGLLTLMALATTLVQLRQSREQARNYQAQGAMHEALLLASAGSLQCLTRMAEACSLQPDDPGLRLQFGAYLRTQWGSCYQLPGNGTQGLLTPDGKQLIYVNSGAPGRVRAYFADSGKPAGNYDHSKLLANCRLSDSGQWLVCPGQDGRVVAWSLRNGQVKTLTQQAAPICCALLDKSEQTCLSGNDRGRVTWTQPDLQKPRLEWRHTQAVTALAWSEDGRYAASGSQDGSTQLWDLHRGRQMRLKKSSSPVKSVIFTQQPEALWVANQDGQIERQPMSENQPLQVKVHGPLLRDMKLQSNGQILSWGGGVCRRWSSSGDLLQEFSDSEDFSSASLNHDGSLLMTGDEDGLAQIWEVATGSAAYRPVHRPGRLNQVGFFPGDQRIFTVSTALDVWDLKGVERLPARLPHSGPVTDFVWHPKRQWLATAQGSMLRLWDQQGQPLGPPLDTGWTSFTLRLSSDDQLLCRSGPRLRLFEAGPQGLRPLRLWNVYPKLQVSRNGKWACAQDQVFSLQDSGKSWVLDCRAAQLGLPSDDGQKVAMLLNGQLSRWGPRGKLAGVTAEPPLLFRFLPDGLLYVTSKFSTLYDFQLHIRWSRPLRPYQLPAQALRVPIEGWTQARCDEQGRSLLVFNYLQAEWLDCKSGALLRYIPASGRLSDGALSDNGDWLCLSGTQGAYLYHSGWSEPAAVPLATRTPQRPIGFAPGPLAITMVRANAISTYPLVLDSTSTPAQLMEQALARSGRLRQGGVEYMLDPNVLASLRHKWLQGKQIP